MFLFLRKTSIYFTVWKQSTLYVTFREQRAARTIAVKRTLINCHRGWTACRLSVTPQPAEQLTAAALSGTLIQRLSTGGASHVLPSQEVAAQNHQFTFNHVWYVNYWIVHPAKYPLIISSTNAYMLKILKPRPTFGPRPTSWETLL